MTGRLRAWLDSFRSAGYGRRPALVLLNGLAEQSESWYCNHQFWRRHFDVHMPNLLMYDGAAMHRRIREDLPISVDHLVEQLHLYLEEYVQTPPYHLVASSMGGKVAVEYAVRYPDRVGRMVLICPSGMGDDEQLPIVEGVRRSDMKALIESVFHDTRKVDPGVMAYYRQQFSNRRWRLGLLRTVRGTMGHCVRERLHLVPQPTLLISGKEDRIVDAKEAATAVRELPQGHFLMIPGCGHAPQIEKSWMINRLVLHFLKSPKATPKPGLTRFLLAKSTFQ